jgi:2-polyprenyl-3-methyl-5-hydroxy-6-metoxy-1,4-benzoquinol methylase
MATPAPAPAPAPAAPTFEEVLNRHASSHCATGTDKTTGHAYGPLYTRIFEPLRTRARRVLEVGVYSGAAVLAMAEFFEDANVTGVDITLDNILFGVGHPRIKHVRVDGTDADATRALGGGWDVVLDDASHRMADQLATFRIFAPRMQPGGVYVIEDIDGRDEQALAAFQAQLGALVGALGPPGRARLEWHDLRSVKGQFDDIVATVTF